MTDITLRLEVAPNDLQRLRRLPLLKSLARGTARTRRLVRSYYDTPELTLLKNRVALHIRKNGRSYVQRVDRDDTINGDGPIHHAWEGPIAGASPDLTHIRDGKLLEVFGDRELRRRLTPVFVSDIKRTSLPLRVDDSEVEVEFDTGEVRGDGGTESICETGLELRAGNAARVYELALEIHRAVPLTIAHHSEAARGYHLMRQEPPRWYKAKKVALDPEMSVREALTRIARTCLWQIQANERCAETAAHIEGVHQLRVAVRRLRSSLSTFRTAIPEALHTELNDELRWLGNSFGPARDWDVFVTETLAMLDERMPHDEAIALLRAESEDMRSDGYVMVRETLASPRYTELLLRLMAWLEGVGWDEGLSEGQDEIQDMPVLDFARVNLRKAYKKMRQFGDSHHEAADEDLHRLRILGKRMRYTSEFFSSLFPSEKTAKFLARLVDLQDTLGSLNDALVASHLLHDLEEAHAGRPEEAQQLAMRSAGIIAGYHAARIQSAREHFGGVWERFTGAKTFWRKPAVE